MVDIQTAGRVVVGTDGSPTARHATEWAAVVARSRSVPLLLVTVVGHESAIAPGSSDAEEHQSEAERLLETEAAHLRATNPDLPIETAVLVGSPAEVLVGATRDAELVVVGARGQSASFGVRTFGGFSDAVATHAEGPVAIVPEGARDHDGPIVVGVDDAPAAKAAIRVAFQIARRTKRKVVAYHAYRIPASMSRYYNPTPEEREAELTPEVDRIVKPIAADFPDVTWERSIVDAHPVWGLVEASKTASVVVLGSRGRGGFASMLLGSTSREVLRNAECPVFIIRAVG
nr:universal stress protein [Propionibacterium sp.]